MMRLLSAVALVFFVFAGAAPERPGDCSVSARQPRDQAEPGPPAVDDEVGQWLDRIEERSNAIQTLSAQVRYHRVQLLLGDEQTRFGRLVYDAGPPARFNIHFDRLAMHGELQPGRHIRFIFDGRWLAEQRDNERVFIRRELVAEDEMGQDLLRLGEGPFALPLGLTKETVLERFDVALVEPGEVVEVGEAEAAEIENAVMLRLTPRPGVEIDQTLIELWYDRDTLLPVQARSVNEDDQTESIIRLREVDTGVVVDEGVFSTQPPREPGWQVEQHALQARGSGGGEAFQIRLCTAYGAVRSLVLAAGGEGGF